MEKIVILGYMGSGKSTFGQHLAEALSCAFYDVDQLIEEELKQDISSIFTQYGDYFFRKKERNKLKQLLQKQEKMVISVGGGTACYFDNMKLINQAAQSLYLRCSTSQLYERLQSQQVSRPLIANLSSTDLKTFITNHLATREKYYLLATHTLQGDEPTDIILQEALKHLK